MSASRCGRLQRPSVDTDAMDDRRRPGRCHHRPVQYLRFQGDFTGRPQTRSQSVPAAAPLCTRPGSAPSKPCLTRQGPYLARPSPTTAPPLASLVQRLKRGIPVTKYGSTGAQKKRLVRLSDDGTDVIWGRSLHRTSGTLALAEVHSIVVGPRTPAFRAYDWDAGQPWLCVSLVAERRTLDVECRSIDDLRCVVLGMQAHAPLSHEFMSHGRLLWCRALLRALRLARLAGLPVLQLLQGLEVDAKRAAALASA